MKNSELKQINTDLQTLGLSVPPEVSKYQDYLRELDSIRHAEARRELQGVESVKDIRTEVEKRTDDVLRAAAKGEQIRLMRDSIHRHIDIAYIKVTDDVIEQLKPIALTAHDTIMKAADKLGDITAEAAVAAHDVKSYDQAIEAHATLETAHRVRMRLHALDAPDIDRQVLRRVYSWEFPTLAAWQAYDRLGDAGSPIANHVATARLEGVTFGWLDTNAAEKQSRALGKAQRAQREANRPAGTYEYDSARGSYVPVGS